MSNVRCHLGVAAVTSLVIGEVIAIGIFLTPATMARTVGSPLWLLVVWLVMGAMALSGALCYGALAARFPEAGGGYVYLRETYGPLVAFLYGWKCLLVMDPGITAALAVGLAGYVGYAFGVWGGGPQSGRGRRDPHSCGAGCGGDTVRRRGDTVAHRPEARRAGIDCDPGAGAGRRQLVAFRPFRRATGGVR